MPSVVRRLAAAGAALAAAALAASGCSGSSTPQPGTVQLTLSDGSVADWATIGVKVLRVSLTPEGGGAPLTVYTAPANPPFVNLVQLDQLSELLDEVEVPAGTYSAATLTLAANLGDVLLVASADPDPGFAGSAGETVPPSDIRIRGATGTAGNRTVSVPLRLASPLVVASGQSSPLDVEFDLSHPVFLVDHVPPGGGAPIWVVSFDGPVRHRPVRDLRRLVLRHAYGSVTSVEPSGAALTFTRVHPVLPPTDPETAVSTSRSVRVLADATNGTLFYDLDAKTGSTVHDFSSLAASLVGRYVRVAARYQAGGSLVAVRVWASNTFHRVWLSPEGHVLHVNLGTNVLAVAGENGGVFPVTVDAGTKFFFRTPERALAEATPIGTGTGFLSNLKRGFKVHVGVEDPLAVPLVARTVDIEIARFDGAISSPDATGFTTTRLFRTAGDDYVQTLDYVSTATTNGRDASGDPIHGFKWWNFGFPTLVDSGPTAIDDFVQATSTTVNFGGTVGRVWPIGMSSASWDDPAAPGAWAASFTILLPTRAPLAAVASDWSVSTGTFGIAVASGPTVTVDVSTVPGSASLVYEVYAAGGVVTVSAVDVTTAAGLLALSTNLVGGTPVKVFGIPRPDGSLAAYVLFYFTGTAPTQ